MVEGFQLFVKDWGPESLLALVILFIATGILETRWSVNKKLQMAEQGRQEALERERYYRDTADKLQATVHLQAGQIGDLMEQARTTVALVNSIESSAYSRPRHGRERDG